jgi:hypothetical protein
MKTAIKLASNEASISKIVPQSHFYSAQTNQIVAIASQLKAICIMTEL